MQIETIVIIALAAFTAVTDSEETLFLKLLLSDVLPEAKLQKTLSNLIVINT